MEASDDITCSPICKDIADDPGVRVGACRCLRGARGPHHLRFFDSLFLSDQSGRPISAATFSISQEPERSTRGGGLSGVHHSDRIGISWSCATASQESCTIHGRNSCAGRQSLYGRNCKRPGKQPWLERYAANSV